ncbi:hypothetical protein K469DRAFT_703711 [Zopfia rhizophila CBS 207.26]|uniref:Uncharacterized protein n=1 Tax=Zopfia rhizophila CBS 207.26 TaxID=1314779 RepID=A0A6A6EAP1_9PEZI|nr:hypothetical protein K469DRAFT_703711 [Zopfia rhizophila CBS 207.26]
MSGASRADLGDTGVSALRVVKQPTFLQYRVTLQDLGPPIAPRASSPVPMATNMDNFHSRRWRVP